MTAEFEAAVLYMFNPSTDASLRDSAISACEQLKQSDDGWRFCLEQFYISQHAEVRFWCLQVVEYVIDKRYRVLSNDHRQDIRTNLLSYLSSVFPSKSTLDPLYIRNKIAVILVKIMGHDYPLQWPTFFADILMLLTKNSVSLTIMVLRVLDIIDDEYVCRDIERDKDERNKCMLIKDSMREQALNDIVEAWYVLLCRHLNDENTGIAAMVLSNITKYVQWIDLSLIANQRFVEIFLSIGVSSSLRTQAIDCIASMVSKGMDPLSKVRLFNMLRVPEVIRSAGIGASQVVLIDRPDAGLLAPINNSNSNISDAEVDFAIAVTRLVTVAVDNILDMWKTNNVNGTSQDITTIIIDSSLLLLNLVPSMCGCFAYDYDDVSAIVVDIASRLSRELKSIPSCVHPSVRESLTGQLSTLLRIGISKMRYDESYCFDNEGDDEAVFQEFRLSLKAFITNIARIAPNLVVSVTRDILSQIIVALQQSNASNTQSLSPTAVENVLHLLYVLGENGTNPELTEMVTHVMNPLFSSYRHCAVVREFFELTVRYSKVFTLHPELFPNVLEAYFDHRGLCNPHTPTRSRAAYLFLRFVKLLKRELVPYLDQIITSLNNGIMDLQVDNMTRLSLAEGGSTSTSRTTPSYSVLFSLNSARGYLSFEDQLYMYEVVGALIGLESTPAESQRGYMEALFLPVVNRIETILNDSNFTRSVLPPPPIEHDRALRRYPSPSLLSIPVDFMMSIQYIIRVVTGMGRLSKGFSRATALATKPFFVKCLEIVHRVLMILAHVEEIRGNALFFLHRMVAILPPEDILPRAELCVTILFEFCDSKDIGLVITFVEQLVVTYRDSVYNMLDNLFQLVGQKIFLLIHSLKSNSEPLSNGAPSSPYKTLVAGTIETDREISEVLCTYLHFLWTLACNTEGMCQLGSILTSSRNNSSADGLLTFLYNSLNNQKNVDIVRLAVAVLTGLIGQWAGKDNTVDTMLCQRSVILTPYIILMGGYNPSDAAGWAFMGCFIQLQLQLYRSYGQTYITAVKHSMSESAIRDVDINDFTQCIQQLLEGTITENAARMFLRKLVETIRDSHTLK